MSGYVVNEDVQQVEEESPRGRWVEMAEQEELELDGQSIRHYRQKLEHRACRWIWLFFHFT